MLAARQDFKMKVCRICLSNEGRLYAMKKQLKSLYQNLTGLDNADKKLPQWLCAECGLRLLSYNKLRQKSLQAHKLLCQILNKSKNVTKKNMLEINSLRLESNLSFSKINITVYNPDIDNQEDLSYTINFSESDLLVPKDEKEDPFEDLELFANSLANNDSSKIKTDRDNVIESLEPEYCEVEFLEEEKSQENLLIDEASIKSDQDYLPSDSSYTPQPSSKKTKLKKEPIKRSRRKLKITKKAKLKKVPLKKPKKERTTSVTKEIIKKENDLKKFFKSFLPEDQMVEIEMGNECNLPLKNDTECLKEDMETEYCEIEFLEDENDENQSNASIKTEDDFLPSDSSYTPPPMPKEAKKKKVLQKKIKNEPKVLVTKQSIPKEDELSKDFTITSMSMEEQIGEIERRKNMPEYAAANHKCDFCFKWFTGKEAYDDHMMKHSLVSGTFECRVCHTRFKTEYYLKCHKRRTHGKMFKCKSCNFATTVRGSAVRHGKLHTGAMYLCPYCVRQFNDVTIYWRHMRVRHNTSADVCAACGYSFISDKGLRVHRIMKHPGMDFEIPMEGPRCEKCNITFASEEAYYTHIRVSVKHKDDTNKVKRRRNEWRPLRKPKPCEECGLQVESFKAYVNHFRRSHPDKDRTQFFSKKAETCMCELCGQLLRQSSSLKDHMSVVHGQEGTRVHECMDCPKTFSQPIYLTKHYKEAHDKDVKVPARIDPYQCPKCGKIMANKFSLRAHLKIHDINRARSHSCDQCGKSFYSNCRLQRHKTIHLGKERFKCNDCHKGFFSKGDLKQHLISTHSNSISVTNRK